MIGQCVAVSRCLSVLSVCEHKALEHVHLPLDETHGRVQTDSEWCVVIVPVVEHPSIIGVVTVDYSDERLRLPLSNR